MKKKKKVGRPKSDRSADTKLPVIRVTKDLLAAIRRDADKKNTATVSDFVRLSLVYEVARAGDRLELEFLNEHDVKQRFYGELIEKKQGLLIMRPTQINERHLHVNEETDRTSIPIDKITKFIWFEIGGKSSNK